MDGRIKVLLVDDEEIYAEALAKVLGRRGLEVSIANDGETALEWLRRGNEVDVVVLDLKMPGMDGLAVLEQIRKIDPLTPVLMLSGHMDLERAARALEGGVGDILLKPCPTDTLLVAIENAKERKEALLALRRAKKEGER